MHLPLALQNDHPSLHLQSTLAHHPLSRTEQAVIGFGIDARQEKRERKKRAVVGSLGQQSFCGNCSGKKSRAKKITVASHKASGRPLSAASYFFPFVLVCLGVLCLLQRRQEISSFSAAHMRNNKDSLCSLGKRQLRRRRRRK